MLSQGRTHAIAVILFLALGCNLRCNCRIRFVGLNVKSSQTIVFVPRQKDSNLKVRQVDSSMGTSRDRPHTVILQGKGSIEYDITLLWMFRI